MKTEIRVGLVLLAVLVFGSSVLAEVPVPMNRAVSGPLPGLQNEEQVWICPLDTSIIVCNHRDFRLGYRQIGIGRGILNGMIWTDNLIPVSDQIFNRQSDPVMTVNSSGEIIICHLDYNPVYDDSSHLAFMVSDDCGASWTGPTTVTPTTGFYFEDKQFIACDRTGGSEDGNVYISWTRFPNPDRIMFARSTDNTQTFEDTLIVGPTTTSSCFGTIDAGQFSQPLVGKDGAVYVFWQALTIDSTDGCDWCRSIRFNKSTDGGVNWQGDRHLRCIDGYNTVDGGINVYGQPTTDADITNGPHAGNLYLQWRDLNENPPYDSEIFCMRSLDTGSTWSAPMRVNDDLLGADVDQFHNWLVCNDEGVLVSIWYDQRIDPTHWMFDVFAGYSFDGGETWTSNHRISSVSSTPSYLSKAADDPGVGGEAAGTDSPTTPLQPMAGLLAEYIGLSSIGDICAAVWTDTRDGSGPGDQDVYSARWHLPLTDPRLIYPLSGEEVPGANPGLFWATAWKESEDSYQLQIDNDPLYGSPERDLILTDNTYDAAVTDLADGLYYWRIKAHKPEGATPEGWTDFSESGSFTLDGNVCDCTGFCDLNGDQGLNPVDVVYMAQYVYQGLDARVQFPDCPGDNGDWDCDGLVNPVDVVWYVNYVYRNSMVGPCDPCNP